MAKSLDSRFLDDPEFQSLLVGCLESLQRGETIDRDALANDHITIVPRVVAVIDGLLAAGIAVMTIDYPVVSFVVVAVAGLIAFGLYQRKPRGWWAAMVLHCLILSLGTFAYVVAMIMLIGDFGEPPNHMALVTNEGFAVILTIVFAVAALVPTIPVFALWSRNCRVACGVLKSESASSAAQVQGSKHG